MILRIASLLNRFRKEERGAVVVDFVPVFFALIVLVLVVFEIGIAYFLSLRSYKAAQIGARAAAVLPALHPGVPQINERFSEADEMGVPCLLPNGPTNVSRCVNPGGPWTCFGSDLSVGGCDARATEFDLIVENMRRTFPDLTRSEVIVSYIYRGLGETGGPFIPEVNVTIEAQAYRFVTFRLGSNSNSRSGQQLITDPDTIYGGVSASAFAENTVPQAINLPPPPDENN